jgi:cyclase
MRRIAVAVALVLAGLASQGALWFGCTPAPTPKVVTIEPVRKNLYVVKGGGGNTAVFVEPSGVVIVDTKLAGWGQVLLDQIRTVTDRPVTTIINTHVHGDHVGNNDFFDTAVDIVAHEYTKTQMEADMSASEISASKGLPTRTFADNTSLTVGGDRIDLYYFGPGHTGGDTVVVFPALAVAHVGDLFADKTLPIVDRVHGGSGIAYPDTLAKIRSGIACVDAIITGHGGLMTWDDLGDYVTFNKEFLDWVRDEMSAGRTPTEAAATYKLPTKYKGYTSAPWQVRANVETIYEELMESQKKPQRWFRGVN